MSNKDIIAKIKVEIERRKKALHSTLFNDEYNDFLSFLSTLESEKPAPNDLEETAGEYAEKHGFRVPYDGSDNFYDDVDVKASKEGFISGAKWQEEKNQETIKLAEDHAFLAGADWQKEQMMKDAVDGEVCIPNVWVEHKEGKELVVRAEISKELGFKFGDKVRVFILKKEN